MIISHLPITLCGQRCWEVSLDQSQPVGPHCCAPPGFSIWGRDLLTEKMKLEAVVVTEAMAEEEESRRAFAKTVHITVLHANTKPRQPMRNSTGSCRMKGKKTHAFPPTARSPSLIHGHSGAKSSQCGLWKQNYSCCCVKVNTVSCRREQREEMALDGA